MEKGVRNRHFFCAAAVSCALSWMLAAGIAAAGDCTPQWDPAIGQPGVDSFVNALTVYNGDLIAGGQFLFAGGQPALRIARWDGSAWHPLASGGHIGVDGGWVNALIVYNGDLIVGGSFTSAGGVETNRVARWDGQSWSPMGFGATTGQVRSFAVYDGDLYAAGGFWVSGGPKYIAKWNGVQWVSVGPELPCCQLHDLAVYDDGTGPALYAAGAQPSFGGVVKWNGSAWSSLGAGTDGNIFALGVFDDGSGPVLVAGGNFTSAGGQPANRVAQWDGSSWGPLGGEAPLTSSVHAVHVFDDGALYLGGAFIGNVARWDGEQWAILDAFLGDANASLGGTVNALATYDDGKVDGPDIVVGGAFNGSFGALPASRIATWRACPADPGEPGIPGDLNGDGSVGVADLLILLSEWGPCPDCGDCPADLTGDCNVGVADLLVLLSNWG